MVGTKVFVTGLILFLLCDWNISWFYKLARQNKAWAVFPNISSTDHLHQNHWRCMLKCRSLGPLPGLGLDTSRPGPSSLHFKQGHHVIPTGPLIPVLGGEKNLMENRNCEDLWPGSMSHTQPEAGLKLLYIPEAGEGPMSCHPLARARKGV